MAPGQLHARDAHMLAARPAQCSHFPFPFHFDLLIQHVMNIVYPFGIIDERKQGWCKQAQNGEEGKGKEGKEEGRHGVPWPRARRSDTVPLAGRMWLPCMQGDTLVRPRGKGREKGCEEGKEEEGREKKKKGKKIKRGRMGRETGRKEREERSSSSH